MLVRMVRKFWQLVWVVACCGVFFAGAAAADPIATVGSEKIDEGEALYILGMSSGGQEFMTAMALAQMNLDARRQLAEQLAEAVLVANAARMQGMQFDPKLANEIKWQEIQVLYKAYLGKVSQGWDMSDKALKNYYHKHKDEFINAPAVRVRHILVETEAEAGNVMLELVKGEEFEVVAEKYSKDTQSAAQKGELGWVERGMTVKDFEEVIFSAPKNTLQGPVKTEYGWHLIEVLEERPARQLPFEEAREEVASRLQMRYLQDEIDRLKAQTPITINDAQLEKLGGIEAMK